MYHAIIIVIYYDINNIIGHHLSILIAGIYYFIGQ